MERAEAFFPLRATTTGADSRCSRRRSAGGDGGTTLFRSVRSDEDGGNPANIAASGASNQTERDARAAQEMGALGLGARTDKELSGKPVFGCHLGDRAGPESNLSEHLQPQRPRKEPELVAIVGDLYGAISLAE